VSECLGPECQPRRMDGGFRRTPPPFEGNDHETLSALDRLGAWLVAAPCRLYRESVTIAGESLFILSDCRCEVDGRDKRRSHALTRALGRHEAR
jgi:hypothetical protein